MRCWSTFLTIEHGEQLADEVAASGKNLTYIYITHGHGDHFFGINALKRRFPNARAVSTASVVERTATQFEPAMMDGVFRKGFPGQIPDDQGLPSIGLIAAGDVVYDATHPYQAESTVQTRLEWIAALDKLEALEARAVVAGSRAILGG